MGQLALGFRSLIIKLAIFFVMAALLAWALGGTLFPRAEVLEYEGVSFDGREWFWRLAVGGREGRGLRWTLMSREAGPGAEAAPVDERVWAEVAGPVVAPDAMYYAGRASFTTGDAWRLERRSVAGPDGAAAGKSSMVLPDRLEVERQLARVQAGLPLESPSAARGRRRDVLDPPPPPPSAGSP